MEKLRNNKRTITKKRSEHFLSTQKVKYKEHSAKNLNI